MAAVSAPSSSFKAPANHQLHAETSREESTLGWIIGRFIILMCFALCPIVIGLVILSGHNDNKQPQKPQPTKTGENKEGANIFQGKTAVPSSLSSQSSSSSAASSPHLRTTGSPSAATVPTTITSSTPTPTFAPTGYPPFPTMPTTTPSSPTIDTRTEQPTTENDNHSIPSPSSSLSTSTLHKCLQGNQQLRNAVSAYVQNMGNRWTFEALIYGYPIGQWCVSEVEDFSHVFFNLSSFNEDISQWDTSRATTMAGMFQEAHSFNQDISQWNVSNVETMGSMFLGASSFNQSLSDWDVSSVRNMSWMFAHADAFNQNLSMWNMTRVTEAESMFLSANAYRQNLCPWGQTLQENCALVTSMLEGTSCPSLQDPDLTADPPGPFCFVCGS